MYKTPCCEVGISWWEGINSRPAAPVKCPGCGRKFHDEVKRKYRWLFYALCISGTVSLLVNIAFHFQSLRPIGYAFGIMSIIILAYDEILIVREGKLVETSLKDQKKDWRRLKIGAVILVIVVLYEVARAL